MVSAKGRWGRHFLSNNDTALRMGAAMDAALEPAQMIAQLLDEGGERLGTLLSLTGVDPFHRSLRGSMHRFRPSAWWRRRAAPTAFMVAAQSRAREG